METRKMNGSIWAASAIGGVLGGALSADGLGRQECSASRCGDVPEAGGSGRVVLEGTAMPLATVAGLAQPAATGWNDGWTTAPVPREAGAGTSSSSQSNAMTPLSASTNGSTKL